MGDENEYENNFGYSRVLPDLRPRMRGGSFSVYSSRGRGQERASPCLFHIQKHSHTRRAGR